MSEPIVNKTCRTCKQVKSITDFSKQPKAKDGYKNKCKVCCAKYALKYFKSAKGREVSQRYEKSAKRRKNKKRYPRISETLSRSITVNEVHHQRRLARSADYAINLNLSQYNLVDFKRYKEIIE